MQKKFFVTKGQINNMKEDFVSEAYQKYIISFLYKGNRLYTLWGTDKFNEDIDYLLINDNNIIITFRSIKKLKDYLNQNIKSQIDRENLKLWLDKNECNRSYATYNIDLIESVLKQEHNIITCSKVEIGELLNFRNLCFDYFTQIKDSNSLKLLYSDKMKLFFEYANSMITWHNDGVINLSKYKSNKIVLEYRKILEKFTSSFLF